MYGSVLAEARRQLASTPLMPAELDLLRGCLPALNGGASLSALRGALKNLDDVLDAEARAFGRGSPAINAA